uniref:Uncharacterized protein n=1 Tax=Solanum lycopersicum TaxID=4081 RepID=A0A3Q7I2G8_SOLLC
MQEQNKPKKKTIPQFPASIYSSLPRIRTIYVLSMSEKTRRASGDNHGVVLLNFLFVFVFRLKFVHSPAHTLYPL